MRIGYSWVRETLSFSKQLMIIVGLLAIPITMQLEKVNAEPAPKQPVAQSSPEIKIDARAVRLAAFFSKLHCPIVYLAKDFVQAADDNSLDWRLLPSISIVESGGGKAARNNNLFGWDNGNQFFPTLRAGINHVAFKLGKSALYRDRDSAGKLRIYNPDANYARTVLDVMDRISPVVNLEPAVARLVHTRSQYVYAN